MTTVLRSQTWAQLYFRDTLYAQVQRKQMVIKVGFLMFNIFIKILFFTLFCIINSFAQETLPLDSNSWVQLSFNKIPPNQVKFKESSILIDVNDSSSPLIYPIKKPKRIKGFKVKGHVVGKIAPQQQGFEEDVYLRFGLIQTGQKKLNTFQRLFAANWVKQLFDLAPKDKGLEIIRFFNLTDQKDKLSMSRLYPGTDLMEELVHTLLQEDGQFTMYHQFPEEIEIAGLWLSSNGDQAQSKFNIQIDSIELY
jgi:hypothetical protein